MSFIYQGVAVFLVEHVILTLLFKRFTIYTAAFPLHGCVSNTGTSENREIHIPHALNILSCICIRDLKTLRVL